jgi:phenylalanyl-tRNA synthetase beta chain
MKISFNRLKAYLPQLSVDPEDLRAVLPLLGLEVGGIQYEGPLKLEHIVVGQIQSSQKHPNADRLSVCTVATDETTVYTIVCGATNYKVGDRVPVALPGAVLPGDFKIKKSTIRGVDSYGMLCSAKELGISSDAQGLLILDATTPLGLPIQSVLPEADALLEIEITANRGDCLSHYGIAREIAAYYELPITRPNASLLASSIPVDAQAVTVDLQSTACPFYTAWLVKDVKVQPSPKWLKEALEKLGMRSINNVVDITNWVMLDQGQPLHAFDAGKLPNLELQVRLSQAGESIQTLDNKERTLLEGLLVVAAAGRPVALAGLMGGKETEVTETTCDILLESAFFDPKIIRKVTKSLDVSSESAYRFVRTVDPEGVEAAALKAIELILQYAGGACISRTYAGQKPNAHPVIQLTCDFVRSVSGIECADAVIVDSLKRLNFEVAVVDGQLQVQVPSYRSDVTRPVDLVEEFIRLYGTDKIPSSRVTTSCTSEAESNIKPYLETAATYLANQGYNECYHYTIVDEPSLSKGYSSEIVQKLALDNPLTAAQTHLRASLLSGLLQSLSYNQAHRNIVNGLFEVGNIFHVHKNSLYECVAIGFVMSADTIRRHWQKTDPAIDFFLIKKIIIQLAALAKIDLNDNLWRSDITIGYWEPNYSACAGNWINDTWEASIGLVNLNITKSYDLKGRIFAGELLFQPGYFDCNPDKVRFESFSLYPAVTKDLSLLVDSNLQMTAVRDALADIIKTCLKDKNTFQLGNVRCFDVYEGKELPVGKKSLTFELTFNASDRSLTDVEVMEVFESIQKTVLAETDYLIRS